MNKFGVKKKAFLVEFKTGSEVVKADTKERIKELWIHMKGGDKVDNIIEFETPIN